MVATVGYQGSESRHLLVQSNYNAIACGAWLALNPVVNSLDYYANTGTANYNAMMATLKHTFSHQFNIEAQYTWAKSMDENSGPYEEDPYPYDSHAAYGRSDYNVANAFKIFGLWQPVIFRGEHNWMEKVVGGWSLSGIYNWHTGFPINPLYNANTSGGLYYNGSGYSSLRPAAYIGGAGMKTGNNIFMQATNPNYNGNGTTYFTAPAFVDGPAFPAIGATACSWNSAQQPERTGLQRSGWIIDQGVRVSELAGIGRARAAGVPGGRIQPVQQAEPGRELDRQYAGLGESRWDCVVA